MATYYSGAGIFNGATILRDHSLLVENGKTLEIVADETLSDSAQICKLDGGILSPGFVETQANGGGGYLFNDHYDLEGMAHIIASHRTFGTVAMLPTFITDTADKYHAAIANVAEGVRTGLKGLAGGHFEGPFLSPERRGTHNLEYLRAPDDADFACWEKHAPYLQNSIISLAPERCPAGTVKFIADLGIQINAAHTMADKQNMIDAYHEGLRGVTHYYNAMRPLAGRDPGVLGAAPELRLYCGIIADGVHSDPFSLAAAYRLLGPEHLMLVTDSMHTIGTDMTEFMLNGIKVFVKEDRLVNEYGSLAGAHVTLLQCLHNAVRYMHAGIADALMMAVTTPALYIRRPDLAKITQRDLDDILWLSDDLQLRELPKA